MASSYFSMPSFSRAQKNKEELEKTNPRSPVLNDEDEKFLERHMSMDGAARSTSQEDQNDVQKDTTATKITEDGKTEEASTNEAPATEGSQVVVPDTATETNASTEDPPEQAPEASSYPTQTKTSRPKSKGIELPSQEDAEAATSGFSSQAAQDGQKSGTQTGEKRTWASYLPTVGSSTKKSDPSSTDKEGEAGAALPDHSSSSENTWTKYASSYIPQSLPTLSTKSFSKDKDSAPSPVLKADGTVDETATAAKQEREVSVLLDNLNMSAINNRVFAFSAETQKIYERFAQVLKDVISGAPTAYEDMDKLMREAGPKLEEQFNAMPPFVQTLVKSLPMKLGPSLMGAAAEGKKPAASAGGDDLKAKVQGASAGTAAGPAAPAPSPKEGEQAKKNKRSVPGLKGLVSQQGVVATMLKNVVTFLQTRFPFLASTTNVVMSLAVFILMFVFWYCHKRGREVRLAKEAEGNEGEVGAEAEGEEEDDLEVEGDEDENAEGEQAAEQILKEIKDDSNTSEKQNMLDQPEPTEVPLPEGEKVNN